MLNTEAQSVEMLDLNTGLATNTFWQEADIFEITKMSTCCWTNVTNVRSCCLF